MSRFKKCTKARFWDGITYPCYSHCTTDQQESCHHHMLDPAKEINFKKANIFETTKSIWCQRGYTIDIMYSITNKQARYADSTIQQKNKQSFHNEIKAERPRMCAYG